MPALASPSTWRTSPYDFTGYLYIDRPEVVFAARVNQGSFSYPLAEVTFDGVTTGAYGDIVKNMTVLFGTSAGADDLGRQRVRKAAGSDTLYIGESGQGVQDGEVDLEDDAYITVLNDYRIWSIAPLLTDDTHYKDWEIPISEGGRNYGSRPGPVAVGGPFRAGLVDPDTDVATFEFDSADSYIVSAGSAISSQTWDVDDGTITVGTSSSAAITATFPAGRRYVKLTVTDDNGDSRSTYILVVALDPDDATWKPVRDFEIVDDRLTREGREMTFIVHEDVAPATFPDGACVMYFEVERYGGSEGSLAGPSTCEGVKFVGWLDALYESPRATFSGIENGVEMRCVSTAQRARRITEFPHRLDDTDGTPADWTEIDSFTPQRFILYQLMWHTTILDVAPPIIDGLGPSYPGLSAPQQTIWDQAAEIAGALGMALTCDQRGVLRLLDDPLLQDSGDRTATEIVSLTGADVEIATFERDRHPDLYWLDGRGITTGGAAEDVFCLAPAAPGQGAERIGLEGQLVASQSVLNARAGHAYARQNSPWLPLRLALTYTGDAGIEPALMEWVPVTLAATTNRRGLSLSDERMLPQEVATRYAVDQRTGLVTKEVELVTEVETVGAPAITVIHPPAASVPGFDFDFEFDFPLEPFEIGQWPGGAASLYLYKGIQNIVGVNSDGYLYRTSDFGTPEAQGGPTWDRVDLSLSGTVYDFTVDPFSPLYIGTGSTVNGWIATSSNLYYVEDLFGASPTVNNQHTFGTAISAAGGRRAIAASFGNYFSNQAWVVCISYYGTTGGHTGTWSIYSQDGGSSWSSEAQITSNHDTDASDGYYPGLYASPKTAGLVYTAAHTSTGGAPTSDGQVSTDYGATFAAISNPDIVTGKGLAGSIHVPWPTNDNEKIVYHGWQDVSPLEFRLKRIDSNGSTIDDISPSDGTRYYGVNRFRFGVTTFDSDRRFVVLAGIGNDLTGSTSGNYHGVWVSDDYGDSWTAIVSPIAQSDPHAQSAAFAGDTAQVIYLWGTEQFLQYSQDLGTTVEDKSGNIPTDYPAAANFIGIAGG